jgi:hypothetical protein
MSTGDKEIDAMQKALEALGGLSTDEQARVISWLSMKLGLGGAPVVPPKVGAQAPQGARQPTGADEIPTAKAFFVAKRPQSDVERIACLAYYLTHYMNTVEFKTKQLSELNKKEAAQPNFSNAGRSVDHATAQNQFLTKSGAGKKRLTSRGEALVDALPGRAKVKEALELYPFQGSRRSAGTRAKRGRRAGNRPK